MDITLMAKSGREAADILPSLALLTHEVRLVEPDVSVLLDADAGDIVLVAGKGHEAGQEIDGVKHPFDDREVVARALESRAGVAPGAVAEGER